MDNVTGLVTSTLLAPAPGNLLPVANKLNIKIIPEPLPNGCKLPRSEPLTKCKAGVFLARGCEAEF